MLAYQRVIEIVFIPFVGSISRCIFITMGCWSGCSCDLCISLYIYVGSICGCIFNNQKWQFKPMKNGFKKTLVMKENQEDWGSIMKFAASFGEKKQRNGAVSLTKTDGHFTSSSVHSPVKGLKTSQLDNKPWAMPSSVYLEPSLGRLTVDIPWSSKEYSMILAAVWMISGCSLNTSE